MDVVRVTVNGGGVNEVVRNVWKVKESGSLEVGGLWMVCNG